MHIKKKKKLPIKIPFTGMTWKTSNTSQLEKRLKTKQNNGQSGKKKKKCPQKTPDGLLCPGRNLSDVTSFLFFLSMGHRESTGQIDYSSFHPGHITRAREGLAVGSFTPSLLLEVSEFPNLFWRGEGPRKSRRYFAPRVYTSCRKREHILSN